MSLAGATLDKFLRWLVIFILTLVISVIGAVPIFIFVLFVEEIIIYPLTILVMGLLAALTSAWLSNLLGGNATRTRLLRIVTTTEVVAILLLPLLTLWVIYIRLYLPNIFLLATWGVVISASACLAARHFRSPIYSRKQDIILSLVLLVLIPVVVVSAVVIAARLGLTGA